MGLFDSLGSILGFEGGDPGAGYNQAALSEFQRLTPPQIQDLLVNLQQEKYAGDYSPQLQQILTQSPSELTNIKTNPLAEQAQMQALAQLQNIGQSGGMTAIDRASMGDILNQAAAAERGSRGAALQNAQARGISGSGLELANLLAGSQNAYNQANQQGLNVAAQAQQRALDAIQSAGNLGGNISNQQFNQAAQKAAAQDAINRFNVQNRQQVLGSNVNTANEAALRNVNTRQNLAGSNTQIANQQALQNAQAPLTVYQAGLQKAQGMGGAYGNLAQGQQQAQNQKNAFTGQLIGTVGNALGGYLANKKGGFQ